MVNEAVFFLFQATLLCNSSSVGTRQILQLGQENYVIITMLQLSVFIAIIYVYCNNRRRDCGVKCKIKPGDKTVISKTSSFIALNFQRPGKYFKTGSSFVGLTWLLTGVSEGKILFVSGTRDLLDVFPESIVISFIHYWYIL